MNSFIENLFKAQDMTSVFSILDVIIVLVLSFSLSLIVAWIYRYTHRGVSYSQSYVHTQVIISVVVALIMLIIGSNIARAFTLVGALSIIRFRNAIKETRDVGFIFLSMAIGMACGTKFYLLAIFATFAIGAFIIVLYKFNLFAKEIKERILMIQVEKGFDYKTDFFDVFRDYLTDYFLISIETMDKENINELVYSVTFRKKVRPEDLIEDLRQLNQNKKITLIEGQQQIDL